MLILLAGLLLGAFVALVFAVSSLVFLLRDKVPYIATPDWVIDWLTENVRLRQGEVVVELGCGDARVLRALVRANPGVRAVGYERNWWPYLLGRLRCRGLPIDVRRENFYTADLREADAVFCYLLTDVMPRLEKLLRSQLKPGARVYSYAFRMPGWVPVEVIANPRKSTGSRMFVYVV